MDVPSIIKMYKENNREEIVTQVKEGKALTKLITESDVFNLGQSSSSGDFSLFGFSFNKLSKKHKNIIGLVFIVIVICILVYLCRLVLVKKEQPKKKKKKEKTK
jgi:phosphotransferase system  glucose/maltose/N-acetylglucosamine-specific IIC component